MGRPASVFVRALTPEEGVKRTTTRHPTSAPSTQPSTVDNTGFHGCERRSDVGQRPRGTTSGEASSSSTPSHDARPGIGPPPACPRMTRSQKEES
jgi:hypothetical protein